MILVLGIGNTLLRDDGVGVHVVEALRSDHAGQANVIFRDGGTIGLSLLPEVQDADAVIVVDAAEIGAAPGIVRKLIGADMDAQLRGKKRTAHEVAVADLLAAAELTGSLPERRALVAVQPASTEWGLTSTTPVAGAIPEACAAVRSLIEIWSHQEGDQHVSAKDAG